MNAKTFNVTFLGTSAASISPRSPTSACLIEVGETKIMVDAGIGVLRQLYKTEVSPDMLDAVLLTHWHFDHCAGLPGLVKSRKKSSPLPIFGPEPPLSMRSFIRVLFPAVFKCFMLVGGNYSIDFPDIHVETFEGIHRITSIGWVLTENPLRNRRVVYSGDTRPTEAIIKAARRADLLIHEATYLERHADRAITRQHSTVSEAVSLALKSEVGGLVLNHTASCYSTKSVRMEVEKILPGVIIPSPLVTISIDIQTDKSKKEGYGWSLLKVSGKSIK